MTATILYPVNELRIGGAEQQLLELVRGLDKSRFRPIVATLYPNGPLDAEFRAVPGVEVIDLHRRGKYDPSPLWRIASLLVERRVDVVQPFLSPATFFGLLPALLVGRSGTVVTERCGVRQVRGWGYKTYRTLEDLLSRFAGAVVPNSQAGEGDLRRRGIEAGKIRVIYNGVNQQRLQADPSGVAAFRSRLNVPANGYVVSILASLTPPKGHTTFLEAAARVARQHDGVRFAIVGDGPLRSQLEAQARSLGIEEQVTFFGYQRGVAEVLSGSDLLVSASQDNEGCSNSILEAMMLGVPVIATDVGGNRELVQTGATGTLVPVRHEDALAAAIESALMAPEQTSAMAFRAREIAAERFSLGRMVTDYESLYSDLLSARRWRAVGLERSANAG